jgi:ATP-dependent exoDNAse (exonuclease V) beta subunit
MTDPVRIADQAARDRALDPATSFIVQAPAGSGKTGLLTQRYLVLLASAEHPEEVVAITFTRKAANEMRERVLKALDAARNADRPEKPHEAHTWELARTVLERDIALQWHLALNPERLRIFTIDSFCSALTRQMPVLSRFGAPPSATDDPERLYRDAAQAALVHLDENDPWSGSVARLLRHFDNNMPVARRQLAEMLARRDQWLRHLVDGRESGERRLHLEQALLVINRAALEQLAGLAPAELSTEVAALARYAANQLTDKPDHPAHACASLATWPGSALEQRRLWEGLANWLLTKDENGKWRTKIDKTIGFPPKETKGSSSQRKLGSSSSNKVLDSGPGLPPAGAGPRRNDGGVGVSDQREDMKARMTALLDKLRSGPPEFRNVLAAVRTLPAERYDDASWEVIEALTDVLLLAVAELTVAFKRSGQADFTAIAQGAVEALGTPDAPTDLALHLDYRIRHLLVDEFQDTSVSQFELLERLTAGWHPGDGRTLFVVGDPMQSIYRFRQAEVGLYLKARHRGVGTVKLEPLTLSVNFRSQAGVVGWVNNAFARILPAQEDIAAGAVPYAPAVARHAAGDGLAVEVHAFVEDEGAAEAQRVAGLIEAARAGNPESGIAVLVRSRAHLALIAPRLKERGLAFRAVEIEALDERPVVQDLLSLTRALTHLADRAAWLAVLRAPWCGLTLADLEALAGDEHDRALWNQMHDPARLARLSDDGRARLVRTRERLAPALAGVGYQRLRRVVEGAWLALGGGACVEKETDLEDARIYLDLIDALDEGGTLPDSRQLAERMDKLFALPDVQAPESLQLMTIHKAKGLEFDTVILPGIGRRPRGDSPPLLRWMQVTQEEGGTNLLLAPIRATGADHDALYNYIGARESEKQRHEYGRLLYVAATRAKQRLHLLGSVNRNDQGEPSPPGKSTLLALLWPMVEAEFRQAAENNLTACAEPVEARSNGNLRRLQGEWTPPPLPPAVAWQAGALPPLPDELPAVEFDWASETTRHVGTVVHRALQQIGREGRAHWTPERLDALLAGFLLALARQGVPPDKLADATKRVQDAVARALKDRRGAWLFDPAHTQAKSEYPLSFDDHGQLVTVIIDRSFVDAHGTRWIVDFKTSTHTGGGLDAFLGREQERYRGQLEHYAAVLRKLESRPIRLGLYFPLLGGWREWEAG